MFPVPPAPPQTPRQYRSVIFQPNITGEDFTAQLNAVPPDSDDEIPTRSDQPPVHVSPIKRRRNFQNINKLSDLEVWNRTDEDILGEC